MSHAVEKNNASPISEASDSNVEEGSPLPKVRMWQLCFVMKGVCACMSPSKLQFDTESGDALHAHNTFILYHVYDGHVDMSRRASARVGMSESPVGVGKADV